MLTDNEITLDQAKQWVHNWQNRNDICGNEFKASRIPIADLTELLDNNPEVEYVRVYLGCYEENGSTIYKTLVVGVNAEGNDIIGPGAVPGPNPNTQIYDMTMPCPNMCDEHSPLYSPE